MSALSGTAPATTPSPEWQSRQLTAYRRTLKGRTLTPEWPRFPATAGFLRRNRELRAGCLRDRTRPGLVRGWLARQGQLPKLWVPGKAGRRKRRSRPRQPEPACPGRVRHLRAPRYPGRRRRRRTAPRGCREPADRCACHPTLPVPAKSVLRPGGLTLAPGGETGGCAPAVGQVCKHPANGRGELEPVAGEAGPHHYGTETVQHEVLVGGAGVRATHGSR